MLPQSLLLTLSFTLIISFPLFSSSHQGKNLANFLEKTPGYDPSIFPSYLGTTDEENKDYQGEVINVENFRAKLGVGQADDTQAFKEAWKEACSSGALVVVVPKDKQYHVKPITFSGPCKADSITLKVLGKIVASDNPADYAGDRSHWLLFSNIQNFLVQGDGSIDGNGNVWWKDSCKINKAKGCTKAPTALSFVQCDNLKLDGLTVVNAQGMHISIEQSVNAEATNIVVKSPETSPDTVGIHVARSENVNIMGPAIETGDDCISIVDGSKNVKIIGGTCGPGHGISVGILEGGKAMAPVSNVLIEHGTLTGTTFGVRVKTSQGGSGNIDNIVFEHINMDRVSNPMIIDQNYCDQGTPCKKQESSVQIRNVMFRHITGTSATKSTSTINCSKTFPCQGVMLKDIALTYKAKR